MCKDQDYCHMVMEKGKSIFEYNQDKKCLKTPFIIYVDTKSLLEKIHACENNSEESSSTEISEHTACGYSLQKQK